MISIFLFSCSSRNEFESFEYTGSIKNEITSLKDFQEWNDSFEDERLSRTLTFDENIAKRNIALTPSTVKIFNNYNSPVYPNVEGFSSLDTTFLSTEILSSVNDFLTNFSSQSFLRSQYYFDDSYVFSLVFFIDDLKNLWKTAFDCDFPGSGVKLFENWYIGKGEYSDDILRIPVRLFCNEGFIDITGFINYSKSNKFFQIHIDSWGGKTDAE